MPLPVLAAVVELVSALHHRLSPSYFDSCAAAGWLFTLDHYAASGHCYVGYEILRMASC